MHFNVIKEKEVFMFFYKSLTQAEKISDEIVKILIDQKQKYDLLKKMKISNDLHKYIDENGKMVFPENSLVHGTSFDKNKLIKIKKDGILSSEFASNTPEKYGETYFMTDFFKNVSGAGLSITELLNCSKNKHLLKFLPSDTYHENVPRVAFILNSKDDNVKKYLSRDLFSKNNSELLDFIDEDFVYLLKKRRFIMEYDYKLGQSSFPIGVPYSALSGIVVDFMIEENLDYMNFIKNTFKKELFIISSAGKILSNPKDYCHNNEQCDTF